MKNYIKIFHRWISNFLNSLHIKIFEGKVENKQSRNLRDTTTPSRVPAWFIIHRGLRLKWPVLCYGTNGINIVLHRYSMPTAEKSSLSSAASGRRGKGITIFLNFQNKKDHR